MNQEQKRKLGCTIIAVTIVYALPWTRGMLSILDKNLIGTITGIHIISLLAAYALWLVYHRDL